MSVFKIEGGTPLSGHVQPRGNKNEALPCLAASLLASDQVVVRNLPLILDIGTMLELMAHLGAQVEWEDPRSVRVCAQAIGSRPDPERCGRIRGSLLLLAPLLARTGEAWMPSPGGDRIGRRRMDPHLQALASFGVGWEEHAGLIHFYRASQPPPTRVVEMDEPSVTATENALMLAAALPGETTIYPAACEPHVQGLARMLQAMGATVQGAGTNCIRVWGANLSGCVHQVASDHIEVGSFVGLAAATHSRLEVTPVDPAVLGPVLRPFRKLGIWVDVQGHTLVCDGTRDFHVERELGGALPVIDDGPWPSIPADIMSIVVVAATQAVGTVVLFEKMFESRLFWVDRLIAMGANVVLCDPHRVVVVGPSALRGTTVASPDIRAGMALVIAALAAHGTSVIHNVEQVDRGYERIDERLASLGARIWREE